MRAVNYVSVQRLDMLYGAGIGLYTAARQAKKSDERKGISSQEIAKLTKEAEHG